MHALRVLKMRISTTDLFISFAAVCASKFSVMDRLPLEMLQHLCHGSADTSAALGESSRCDEQYRGRQAVAEEAELSCQAAVGRVVRPGSKSWYAQASF